MQAYLRGCIGHHLDASLFTGEESTGIHRLNP